jgi:hypothetical protein
VLLGLAFGAEVPSEALISPGDNNPDLGLALLVFHLIYYL